MTFRVRSRDDFVCVSSPQRYDKVKYVGNTCPCCKTGPPSKNKHSVRHRSIITELNFDDLPTKSNLNAGHSWYALDLQFHSCESVVKWWEKTWVDSYYSRSRLWFPYRYRAPLWSLLRKITSEQQFMAFIWSKKRAITPCFISWYKILQCDTQQKTGEDFAPYIPTLSFPVQSRSLVASLWQYVVDRHFKNAQLQVPEKVDMSYFEPSKLSVSDSE